MKEKTFEELAKEAVLKKGDGDNKYLLSTKGIEEMLIDFGRQVREATKEECRDIASEFSLSETLKHIDNLPTDRIKTEK